MAGERLRSSSWCLESQINDRTSPVFAKRWRTTSTPTQLGELVFEFEKHVNASTRAPVWELSDRLGHRVIKSGFKEALLAFLPDWLSPSTRKAMHFAVHQMGGVP